MTGGKPADLAYSRTTVNGRQMTAPAHEPAQQATKPAPSRRWLQRRWLIAGLAAVLTLSILPVPWLHVVGEDPVGWAWRLDGRLVVEGQIVDPPGRWSWLTVGRPPLVAEVVRDRILGTTEPARDMRVAAPGTQPRLVEPVAAAVGMLHAGRPLELGLVVEASGPRLPGFPDRALIVSFDGVQLESRADWIAATRGAGPAITFRTADGQQWSAPGPSLPYEVVRVVDLGPELFTASIGGPFTRVAPVDWFRSLSLGNSHGMMVALLTYVHESGDDLARGRHSAGTGGVLGDGTVTRIGGLGAKAAAARRAGADVMLFPASQSAELAAFDPGAMVLVPVESLAEAIAWLRG